MEKRKLTKADLDRMRSVGYLGRGRTRNRVREYKRADGIRVKETTDEHNNTTTEHATKDDRVDVMIRPETIRVKGGVNK
jgi:hypothetical protein